MSASAIITRPIKYLMCSSTNLSTLKDLFMTKFFNLLNSPSTEALDAGIRPYPNLSVYMLLHKGIVLISHNNLLVI